MKNSRLWIIGLAISLVLAGLAILFRESRIYSVALIVLALFLVLITLVSAAGESFVRVLTDPDGPIQETRRIYREAAISGGTIHATHVFPIDRNPDKDIAVDELSQASPKLDLTFERILLLDSIEDERLWLEKLFGSIKPSISKTFHLLRSYPLLFPRIAKALLPRLNLLLYQTQSGRSCISLIGLDRLHIAGTEVNFAIRTPNKRAYRALLKYFVHITGSGHFRAYNSINAYNETRRASSQVERGQSVISRIVDFAETTPGVESVGMFGSMARAALGLVADPVSDQTDADVDLVLLFDPRGLGQSIDELQRAIEDFLNPATTRVTWGPKLAPFYEFRDEERIDVDIECHVLGSDFHQTNKLLGYSIFRYFIPLYSVDQSPLISHLPIPNRPLSTSQRWHHLLGDRQGLSYFLERLNSTLTNTDPRRLCAHVLRNSVWALTGFWLPSGRAAGEYLANWVGWTAPQETLERARELLTEPSDVVRSDLGARYGDVHSLINTVLSMQSE